MEIHCGARRGTVVLVSVFRIYHRGTKTRVGTFKRNKRAVRLERGEVLGTGRETKKEAGG